MSCEVCDRCDSKKHKTLVYTRMRAHEIGREKTMKFTILNRPVVTSALARLSYDKNVSL